MEILAWNCRGIGNDAAVQGLKKLIHQHHPSFIFLSETKVSDPPYMRNLRLEIGYLNCEVVFSRGQSGGLALFWRDGIDVRFRSKSNHHIDVEVLEGDGSGIAWRLTGFYGHPTLSERHWTWSLLRDLCQQSALPWTVIGDFNEILHSSEKEGGCIRREGQMKQFRDALSFCDLIDFGYFGSPFTWSRGGVKCRLDRVVGSVSWTNIFPAVRVSNLKPIHGDHVPVLLGAYHSPPPPAGQRRRPRFRFESFWVRHEACVEVIKSGWASDDRNQPMLQVSQKIMHTRFALNDWQRATFGRRGREIEFLRGRLQSLLALPISAVNQQESMELSSKLDGLLAEEHEYWKQRSKLTWLTEGDRNTKFFHRKASNRRAKNRLTGLFDNHGVWQSTEKGLEAVVIDYFSSMFSAGDVDLSHMFSVVDLVQPKVTPEMNSMLCAPYTAVLLHQTYL